MTAWRAASSGLRAHQAHVDVLKGRHVDAQVGRRETARDERRAHVREDGVVAPHDDIIASSLDRLYAGDAGEPVEIALARRETHGAAAAVAPDEPEGESLARIVPF